MEQEPTALELLTELCRLQDEVSKVNDDLDVLLRRASKAKQLRALREGMVSLRGTVDRLQQRVSFLAPPPTSWAELAALRPSPKYLLEELQEMNKTPDGRRQIFRVLQEYGARPSTTVTLHPTARIRLLLQLQEQGAAHAFHRTGLTPALIKELEIPFDSWPRRLPPGSEVPRIYSSAELCELTASGDRGRLEIRNVLQSYGVLMTDIVRLCSTGRHRFLLYLQEYGKDAEYYAQGLSPALRRKLGLREDFTVDPALSGCWPDVAKDYAAWDVAFTLQAHSDPHQYRHLVRDAAFWVGYAGDFGKPCDRAKTLYKKPTLEEIETHKADEVKRIQEKFFEAWPAARTYVEAHRIEEQRLREQAPKVPALQDLRDLKRILEGPKLRVKQTVVTSRLQKDTPVASSQGLGWCARHHVGFRGYCADCHPDGDPAVKACVCGYCGKAAQGNFAIHRDGLGEGPEVDLCDACGDCDETVLSCEQIWEKFAKEGICQ